MPVAARDLRAYAEDSGVPFPPVQVGFSLFGGDPEIAVVSSNAGDTGFISVDYRDRDSQDIFTSVNVVALTGQTPNSLAAPDIQTVLAGLPPSTAGDLLLYNTTVLEGGTAQGGTASSIQLRAAASAVDGAFQFKVIRLTGGTGAGQVNLGRVYVGSSRQLTVEYDWDVTPASDTTYEIYDGMYFRRADGTGRVSHIFWSQDPTSPGTYYGLFFMQNDHPTDSLTSAIVKKTGDALGVLDFALDAALGGGQAQPDEGDFDSLDKGVPGGTLGPGAAIGVWVRLTLAVARNRVEFRMALEGDNGV